MPTNIIYTAVGILLLLDTALQIAAAVCAQHFGQSPTLSFWSHQLSFNLKMAIASSLVLVVLTEL